MKKITFLIALFCGVCVLANAQNIGQTLPEVKIKDLQGNIVSAKDLVNKDGVAFISFWATWCKPCVNELNAVNDYIEEWKSEANIKVFAVSVDDSRSVGRVRSFVSGRKWSFDVFTDENADLKRALNVNDVPHAFIINKEGKIVWQHTSYKPGDEDEYIEIMKKVINGEEINK
jgi:peroxiredoxin